MNSLLALPAAALACFFWGLIEAKLYRIRGHTLAVLPPGAPSIRILQVSDLHLRRSNRRLARFLESLSNETFDVVLATGDLIGEPKVISECARLLNQLRARSGRYFVLGASDYYSPKFKNYLDYFLKRRRPGTRRNPTSDFTRRLLESGWIDLTNVNSAAEWKGIEVQLTGLDDAYLRRDDRTLLGRDAKVSLAVCVTHDPAPYLDAAARDYDLVISGHTHGGQVRFPFIGAVVTNSDVPRNRARWTSRVGRMLLFVSPGLGTGKYAPFRFLCRPEASVLELDPRAQEPQRSR